MVLSETVFMSYILYILQEGFDAVLAYDPSLCVLAYCLNNDSTRIKVLILKVGCAILNTYNNLSMYVRSYIHIQCMLCTFLNKNSIEV